MSRNRKPQKKSYSAPKEPKDTSKKLSAQKRHELEQLIDALLKLGFKQTSNIGEQWEQYLEIQSILNRIQAIENCLKVKISGSKSRSNCIETFYKWAKDNDAQFDGVKISEFSGYELGLEALKEFKKDDVFITIPRKMIMSEETLTTTLSSICNEIPMFDTMANVKLAFALLLEKLNPNSFWKPYIDILPERYSTVMYFSVNEMQELKGSNSFGNAMNQCKSIARQYAFIHKCIQNIKINRDVKGGPSNGVSNNDSFDILKDKFTFELYRWAVSSVMTRQNAIPRSKPLENKKDGGNNDMMPALIPLWDMANHKDGEVTSSFNMELDRLESCALSDYTKGDQIFIYYGDRSNGDLLIHNGFVYPDNKRDYVTIRLGLSNSDELYAERSQLLELLNLPKNCDLKILPSPEFISKELLAFARIFNMSREQLQHWINSKRANDLLHIDCALETSLETRTWFFLQTRLFLLLRVSPTTLQDDEKMLANHNKGQSKLGHIRSMLLQFRILEKKMLTNALDYARQRIKF